MTKAHLIITREDGENIEKGNHECVFHVTMKPIHNTDGWPYRGMCDNPDIEWSNLTPFEVERVLEVFCGKELPRATASAELDPPFLDEDVDDESDTSDELTPNGDDDVFDGPPYGECSCLVCKENDDA